MVDTEFGRLGFAICEDLLWRSPVVELVEEGGIDTLLIPLSWWDMFPHQLAHSNEDAWARGLQVFLWLFGKSKLLCQVNLLAANNHVPSDWNSGSGIFTPVGHAAYYHNVTEGAVSPNPIPLPGSGGRLLVADIPISTTPEFPHWSEYAKQNLDNYPNSEEEFTAVVYDDQFTFVPMDPTSRSAKVCTEDGSLCCLADFIFEEADEIFSLGVFSGTHTKDGSVSGSFYIEMCTIMKCDPNNVDMCEQDKVKDYTYLTSSNTVFQKLQLSGTFSEEAKVYPEVLFHNTELIPEQVEISPEGVLLLRRIGDSFDPVLSMSLFGRRYAEDSPLPDHFCPGSKTDE